MKQFFDEADYIHVDGMPIILLGKAIGANLSGANRLTYLDWIDDIFSLASKNQWRVFYLGSKQEVTDMVVDKMQRDYPNVAMSGTSGYFDVNGPGNQEVIDKIKEVKPHVLFVGMGMPRQEVWIRNNYPELSTNVFLPCGACFEYLVGISYTPPRWAGKMGLEWLVRFLSDPKRLFFRYFVEPFALIPFFLRVLRSKKKK